MDAAKKNFDELFSPATHKFEIPVFQREYVWTREGQWEQFAEDLRQNALQKLESDAGGWSAHFFGTVVLKKEDFQTDDCSYIIDGQQRLITCLIFTKALIDVLKGIDGDYKKYISQLEIYLGKPEQNGGESLKLRASYRDRKDLDQIINADPNDDCLQVNNNLAQAYCFFRDDIKNFLQGNANEGWLVGQAKAERVRTLVEVLQKSAFACITLGSKEDANEVFEALNGRGQPLLASDLIRNYVFHSADSAGCSNDRQVDLYNFYWHSFSSLKIDQDDDDKLFWHQPGTKGVPRIEQFFVHFLQCHMGNEVKINQLLKAFRKWWEDEQWKAGNGDGVNKQTLVRTRLEMIRKQANVYASFYGGEFPDVSIKELSPILLRLREHQHSTVYAVLLYVFAVALIQKRIEKSDLATVCYMVEDYLVRRFVCRMSTNKYNHVFLNLVQQLRGNDNISAISFRQLLSSFEGESMRWPSDDEFKRHWLVEGLYASGSRRQVLKAMLSAIDNQLKPCFAETASIDYDALTLEHVLPQVRNDNWPEAVLPGNAKERFQTDQTDADIRKALLNSIGNLTLVNHKLNASMRNGPFTKKNKMLNEHSSLEINKYFLNLDAWNEESILVRAEKLYETAKKLWPGPQSSGIHAQKSVGGASGTSVNIPPNKPSEQPMLEFSLPSSVNNKISDNLPLDIDNCTQPLQVRKVNQTASSSKKLLPASPDEDSVRKKLLDNCIACDTEEEFLNVSEGTFKNLPHVGSKFIERFKRFQQRIANGNNNTDETELNNPYQADSSYHFIFECLKSNEGFIEEDIIKKVVNRFPNKDHKHAIYDVTVVLSPRHELTGKCKDVRGSKSAQGHLYFAKKDEDGRWQVFKRESPLPKKL